MSAIDFLKNLPKDEEKYAGMSTLFHFDLKGENGGQLSLKLDDGDLKVIEGLEGEPKCVVTADDTDLLKVLNGETNPMMAVMTGKLKISNVGEMMKYAKLFGLM